MSLNLGKPTTLCGLVLIDDLTGLHNRRGFLTFSEQHLKLARRTNQELLLVFLDLDGLKQINDTFGHSEGDRALAKTAKVLKQVFHRKLDLIARLGGDEFVVLTMDSLHQSSESIYLRLQKHLEIVNTDIDRGCWLSLCIGVTHFDPKSRTSINDLMARADEALYKNKRGRTVASSFASCPTALARPSSASSTPPSASSSLPSPLFVH